MELSLTEDQLLLAKSARELLERECTPTLVRALRDSQTGHSTELWRALVDHGWVGVALPERLGGSGASTFELGLFMEQAGRVLLPTSYAATTFAIEVLRRLRMGDVTHELLEQVCAGEAVVTVALAEREAVRDPASLRTEVRRDGDRWLLRGEKMFVVAAPAADVVLVVARRPPSGGDGEVVVAVDPRDPGVEISPHITFGRDHQSSVRLDDVVVPDDRLLIGDTPSRDTWRAVDESVLVATALQCAEMVGGADRVLETTADYVKERHQFGRPIGTFQAVQHHVADMATSVEAGRWATHQALWRLAEGLPAAREVAIAKAWCAPMYTTVTQLAHQLHGGAGIVVEHDLHLWSERAKVTQVHFGGRDVQLRALATQMGLPAHTGRPGHGTRTDPT